MFDSVDGRKSFKVDLSHNCLGFATLLHLLKTLKVPFFFPLRYLSIHICISCSKATAVLKGCVVSILTPLKKKQKREKD